MTILGYYAKILSTRGNSRNKTIKELYMKKIISTVLLCVLLVSSLFVLASCNTISGTYGGEVDLVLAKYKVTYEFKGNDVTVTSQLTSSIGSLNPVSVSGTYEIGEDEEGNKTITFDYSDSEEEADGAAKEGTALSFNQGKDDNGKYIEIAGAKYYEVK